jgi:hypothetical protein
MEPFSPQDPLTKLLAQARKIEARSNFTQNVVRAARQTPQDRGWLAAVRAWWEDVGCASAGQVGARLRGAAAMAADVCVLQTQSGTTPQVVEQSSQCLNCRLLPAAETPWETAYQTEALLAVEDTTQFTDSEIGFLLY